MENGDSRQELVGERHGGEGQDPDRVLAPVKKNETKYLTVKSGTSNVIGLCNGRFLHKYRYTCSI
jgi:hypothetical protein